MSKWGKWLDTHIETLDRLSPRDRDYLAGWSNVAGFVFWAQGSVWHRAAQESIVAGIVASASRRLQDPFAEGQRDAALSALGLV